MTMPELLELLSNTSSFVLVMAAVYFLGKTFLSEKKEDKENYRADMKAKEAAYQESLKEQQSLFKNELVEARQMYKEELAKDRELYVSSMQAVFGEIDALKDDIKDLTIIIKGDDKDGTA